MTIRWRRTILDDSEALREHPAVIEAELELGEQVAARAREFAAVRTGRLRMGIHAEVARDPFAGIHIRVSYDKDEFWGLFNELGTTRMRPQPFLRPAADEFRQAHPNFRSQLPTN